MADSHAQAKHPYHLVDPSPWPILGGVSAFLLTLGSVFYMHDSPLGWLLFAGAIMTFYTMYVWWRDVVREAESGKYHTNVVQLGLRYGMALFILSEVMFFVAWFWAYFSSSIYPTEFIGSVWPPQGVETLDPWHLPFVNTLILLLSGTTVTWAHHALQHGDRGGLINGLALTIVLGLSFTGIQVYEYIHAAFSYSGNIYGATFFMATGFHGAHVIIGTIFLIVCYFRAVKGHFKPDHHFGFEAAAWYWHFVDVVWIFLFVNIYVLGAGTPAAH